MKKLAAIIVALLIFIAIPPQKAQAAAYSPPFDVSAEAVYFVNMDTGVVVYEKNAQKQMYPASLTKLMTCILLFENVQDLDGTTMTAPGYIFDEFYGLNVSTADIRRGETVTARELLYAMLLQSANEGASIVADNLGGGNINNFVAMMNAKATELGCTGTNFANPHGLFNANHYTTAYDMYLIANYAYDIEGFMDIASTSRYLMAANNKHAEPRYLLTTINMQNKGSEYYKPYIKGMKTGTLPESGHCFISTSVLNGERYMLVILNATGSDPKPAFKVAEQLYNWAYNSFTVKEAFNISEPVTEIPLKYSSEQDVLLLYPESAMLTLLPEESDSSVLLRTFNLPAYASAPIAAGDVVGTVTLSLAGENIGTVNLVSAVDVKRNMVLFVISKIGEFMSTLYFKIVAALLIIVFIVYIVYIQRLNSKNAKRGKIRRRRP